MQIERCSIFYKKNVFMYVSYLCVSCCHLDGSYVTCIVSYSTILLIITLRYIVKVWNGIECCITRLVIGGLVRKTQTEAL